MPPCQLKINQRNAFANNLKNYKAKTSYGFTDIAKRVIGFAAQVKYILDILTYYFLSTYIIFPEVLAGAAGATGAVGRFFKAVGSVIPFLSPNTV